MDRRTKQAAPQSTQSSTHPEAQKKVKPGVADEQSSKASGKETDARSPHDRDGNQGQPRRGSTR